MDKKIVAVEKVLGIEVFGWTGWDDGGDQMLQFYGAEFYIDELKQYNGAMVVVPFGWEYIAIYHGEDFETETKINLLNIPTFAQELFNKIS